MDIYKVAHYDLAINSNRMISLFEAIAGVPLTASKRALLEQCAVKIYQPFISSYNPDTGLYDHSRTPTVRDLYRELRGQDNNDARQLADMLKHLLPESLEDIHEDHL